MKIQKIVKILSDNRAEIESRFNVASLSIFGSAARQEATEKSDIDILVTYKKTPGIFGFLELKEYLEEILGCSVDLVTKKALKEQLRDQIIQESVHAV